MENNSAFTEQQLTELNLIKQKYKAVIQGDSILQNDFEDLIMGISTYEPMSVESCNKIVEHLIAETSEAEEDFQRMDNEGAACIDEDTIVCKNIQEHIGLKKALEEYHVNYLAA